MSDFILSQLEASVLKITLNRPEVFNSFNREMALKMQEILESAKSKSVRCVLITGNGKAFCAGQDLQEVTDPNGPALTTIISEHYNPIIRLIRALEKPVIAAINGVAAGAGANIALACDVVVAHEQASFIQAFSKIGLIPDSGGTYTLPRLIGWQKASALMMLGDKVSAEDAEKMGMIYKVYSASEFNEKVNELAVTLSNMPTLGLALTKKALQSALVNDLEAQLILEDQLQTAAGLTYDYEEGVNSFLEKRKPNFKGE